MGDWSPTETRYQANDKVNVQKRIHSTFGPAAVVVIFNVGGVEHQKIIMMIIMENAFTPRLTSNDEQERRINGPPELMLHHLLHNNDNSVCQSLSFALPLSLSVPFFVDNL